MYGGKYGNLWHGRSVFVAHWLKTRPAGFFPTWMDYEDRRAEARAAWKDLSPGEKVAAIVGAEA